MVPQKVDPKSSTYLITGGAGFIGSHLADALLADGHTVRVIDDFSTGRIENIRHLMDSPRFTLVRASVTDPGALDELMEGTDVVVHLAAAVGVRLILERPVHTIRNNVAGTEAVLEAALGHGCRVLIASTSEVYGKGTKFPFGEEDDVLLGPTSKNRWGYAASKMVDEFMGLAYHQEYGLPVVVFRLFNTVGPRQTGYYGMVIPRFVELALRQEPITVYGDGTQTRTFCDVSDTVRALTGLATHPDAPGSVYNVGGTSEVSMRELAERIKDKTGSGSEITYVPYERAYGFGPEGTHAAGYEDMQRRLPDTRRVEALLGWRPERGLDDILDRVVSTMKRDARPVA